MPTTPELDTLVFCDQVNSYDDGRYDLVGIYDTVDVEPTLEAPLDILGQPALGQITIFIRWARGEGQFNQKIRFWDFEGTSHDIAPVVFRLKDRNDAHNIINKLTLAFRASAKYRFAVLLNGKVVAERRLTVRVHPFPRV